MYAVVSTGGKQYKVRKGEILRVEKLSGDVGQSVFFDKVLMFSDGKEVKIGQPVLDDIDVQGHIVEQGKSKKIIVFKYKRRKRYRRKRGHRQLYTAVRIDKIGIKGADDEESSHELETKPAAVEEEISETTKVHAGPTDGETSAEPAPSDQVKPEDSEIKE